MSSQSTSGILIHEIELKDDMTKFMIRNIFGHEPIHDFNPSGTGKRYINLDNKISSLTLRQPQHLGGSNNFKETPIVQSGGGIDKDADIIDLTIGNFKYTEEDSTVNQFNTNCIDSQQSSVDEEDEEEEKNDEKGSPPNNSTISSDYTEFLSKFMTDPNNMIYSKKIKDPHVVHMTRFATRRISEQAEPRLHAINALQNITEMTD